MLLPVLVAHADWSVNAGKRWMACAWLEEDGRYRARSPERVGDPGSLLGRLWKCVGASEAVLLGFDFPIGLPYRYAEKCGVGDFLALLPRLGEGQWADFYRPAEDPAQICLQRPFYPLRPGGARQAHLLQALGMETMDDLRRQCELPYPGRRAAAPLFWTLGGQQVGKAAISGWRDVLAPALRSGQAEVAIWPFSGCLEELLRPGILTVAETYPGEFYHHLGVVFPFARGRSGGVGEAPSRSVRGKRSRASRAVNAEVLLTWARSASVRLSAELETALRDGFGPTEGGEDPFDAVIGLFGMLNVLLGRRSPGEPLSERLRKIEGWILGQSALAFSARPGRRQGA